jgi:hypothetical protein
MYDIKGIFLMVSADERDVADVGKKYVLKELPAAAALTSSQRACNAAVSVSKGLGGKG